MKSKHPYSEKLDITMQCVQLQMRKGVPFCPGPTSTCQGRAKEGSTEQAEEQSLKAGRDLEKCDVRKLKG
jgi:hypothetical protein